jgi:UDP-N-acetyl-D-mannosaminuronic acid transferase (WecB/TagA/CpsF family)
LADVFLSYSKKDFTEALAVASLLQAEGYSVWWDSNLLGGEDFRRVIMTD